MAKVISPGVAALRKVVEDVYAAAREAKKNGELVGWSSSKFPCELAEAFDLKVVYPENQAAGVAANRDGEIMCQAAEDLGYDNDICGYARISLAYAAGKRAARKFDPATGEYIINPNSGKPLKDENGNVVIDEATGKPKKDPKTMAPYTVLDDIYEIEALPDGPEKERRWEAIKPYRQMRIPQPDFVLCCNNICNCMTKWYENIARMNNIPLIMIDIPYNNEVGVPDNYVAYIRGQFDAAIVQLEELTGKKFDQEKFNKACSSANRTAKAWLKVCDLCNINRHLLVDLISLIIWLMLLQHVRSRKRQMHLTFSQQSWRKMFVQERVRFPSRRNTVSCLKVFPAGPSFRIFSSL